MRQKHELKKKYKTTCDLTWYVCVCVHDEKVIKVSLRILRWTWMVKNCMGVWVHFNPSWYAQRTHILSTSIRESKKVLWELSIWLVWSEGSNIECRTDRREVWVYPHQSSTSSDLSTPNHASKKVAKKDVTCQDHLKTLAYEFSKL